VEVLAWTTVLGMSTRNVAPGLSATAQHSLRGSGTQCRLWLQFQRTKNKRWRTCDRFGANPFNQHVTNSTIPLHAIENHLPEACELVSAYCAKICNAPYAPLTWRCGVSRYEETWCARISVRTAATRNPFVATSDTVKLAEPPYPTQGCGSEEPKNRAPEGD
jgi:hypothetical protein